MKFCVIMMKSDLYYLILLWQNIDFFGKNAHQELIQTRFIRPNPPDKFIQSKQTLRNLQNIPLTHLDIHIWERHQQYINFNWNLPYWIASRVSNCVNRNNVTLEYPGCICDCIFIIDCIIIKQFYKRKIFLGMKLFPFMI